MAVCSSPQQRASFCPVRRINTCLCHCKHNFSRTQQSSCSNSVPRTIAQCCTPTAEQAIDGASHPACDAAEAPATRTLVAAGAVGVAPLPQSAIALTPCPHLHNVGARGQTVVLREVGEVELLQDGAIGAVRRYRRAGGPTGVSAGMWLIKLMCSSSPGCDVGLAWRLLSAVTLTGPIEPGQARSISKLKTLTLHATGCCSRR